MCGCRATKHPRCLRFGFVMSAGLGRPAAANPYLRLLCIQYGACGQVIGILILYQSVFYYFIGSKWIGSWVSRKHRQNYFRESGEGCEVILSFPWRLNIHFHLDSSLPQLVDSNPSFFRNILPTAVESFLLNISTGLDPVFRFVSQTSFVVEWIVTSSRGSSFKWRPSSNRVHRGRLLRLSRLRKNIALIWKSESFCLDR